MNERNKEELIKINQFLSTFNFANRIPDSIGLWCYRTERMKSYKDEYSQEFPMLGYLLENGKLIIIDAFGISSSDDFFTSKEEIIMRKFHICHPNMWGYDLHRYFMNNASLKVNDIKQKQSEFFSWNNQYVMSTWEVVAEDLDGFFFFVKNDSSEDFFNLLIKKKKEISEILCFK